MQTRARVRDIGAGRVRLECDSATEACGACAGRRGCALRWLAGPGQPVLDIDASGPEARTLRPGDGVIVEVDDGELLRAAARAYLPPLTGLLGGAVVMAALLPGRESAALAGAVVGLVAGWLAARAGLQRLPPRYRLRIAEDA